MNNNYIINNNTLLFIPSIDKNNTIIYEDKKSICINQTCFNTFNSCLKYYGNTYKGRFENSKIYLNLNIKLPIIVEESNEIIFFPTSSIRNKNCMWLSFNNIYNIRKLDKNNTIILFKNGIEFNVVCSYSIINNQLNKCAKLKCTLIEKKRALNV